MGLAMMAVSPSAWAQSCGPAPAPPPTELAGWATRVAAAPAKDVKGLNAAVLPLGKAVSATLLPGGGVSYAVKPEKPYSDGSYGGLFAIDVKAAGNYRIALGAGAWVDVVKHGKSVASATHGHGPDCSGIRKMVDFALTPGRHVVQLSGASAAAVTVMAVKLP